MKRSMLTALAAAIFHVTALQAAFANDTALAFFNLQTTPTNTQQTASPEKARAGRAVLRLTEGPAASDIAALADQMGVPHGLALSVCRVETHCRYGVVGRQGERGPLQIKLQTARGLGYTGTAAGLNGHAGAYWGMKHLQAAYRKCGNARGAARVHNAGLAAGCGGSVYASRVVAGL